MPKPSQHVPTVSDGAVEAATDRRWDAWFAALDEAGAAERSHKEIVAWPRDEASLANASWQQNVTMEYEKARGMRATVGETADAGFQVGAQRTVDLSADEASALAAHDPARPGRPRLGLLARRRVTDVERSGARCEQLVVPLGLALRACARKRPCCCSGAQQRHVVRR